MTTLTLTLNPISVLFAKFGGGKATAQPHPDIPRAAAAYVEIGAKDQDKVLEPLWQGQWSTLKYL